MDRKTAKASGLKWYFTGKPCSRGHVSERLVSNCCCKLCALGRFKKFYQDNKERMLNRTRDWRSSKGAALNEKRRENRAINCLSFREKSRALYAKDPERAKQQASSFRKRNPEKVREMQRSWKSRNRAKATALQTLRDAAKSKATPAWASKEAIEKIYAEAARITRETGIEHQVDHIIPIRGRDVVGLHVEYNLQVITAIENKRKGNRFRAHSCNGEWESGVV